MAKKNIKEEIVNKTRRLYNQHGVLAVSMRDIADAMGISVGNLTYHFPRKEDLTEAVILDMFRYYRPPAVPKTLQQLNAVLARMQNDILQNAFYFWHQGQVGDIAPEVREKLTGLLEAQCGLLQTAFAGFSGEGLFAPESHEGHFAQLAKAVQILSVFWVPQSRLDEGPQASRDFLDCVWGVLLPCLTPQGQQIYRDKIQKVRVDFDALPQ